MLGTRTLGGLQLSGVPVPQSGEAVCSGTAYQKHIPARADEAPVSERESGRADGAQNR